MVRTARFLPIFVIASFFTLPRLFAEPKLASTGIIGLDFGDLQDIEVTSVSKREDKLNETAAAIHVITAEDIRRSGATSLAEVLRLAPGLQVARANSNTWAISSRGFNSTAANKLLVMIDGRSVYTPLFSGVFWDVQNVLLDNVERIEVIRGPGASVWGANAVNGVINIIRKPSGETQGGRVAAGGGTELRGFGSVRYGGKIGDRGYYRAHSLYFDRDDTRLTTGGQAGDNWHMASGGFRMDLQPSSQDSFMVAADAYDGKEGQVSPVNALTFPFQTVHRDQTDVNGGNVMGRWARQLKPRSQIQFQTFYDRTMRHIPLVFKEVRDTYDAEIQHGFPLGQIHNLIWGLGFRLSDDRVRDAFSPDFNPNNYTTELYSSFIQNEIRAHRKLIITLGSRFEYNDFTGLEIQPNVRASWLVNPQNTLWTSVSRAVRTPTRLDRHAKLQIVASTTTLATLSFRGDDTFDSEELIAYEIGYRTQPSPHTWIDFASFYNVYDNLLSVEQGSIFIEATPAPAHPVVPFYFHNKANAESYGFEFVPQHQLTDWWRIQAQYTYLHLRIHLENDAFDTLTIATEGNNPKHQAGLRTAFNLPWSFELDGGVRYVDNLRPLGVGSYTVLDARLAYRGIRNLDLEIVGQNLTRNHHQEFAPGNEIEDSVYGRAIWKF